MKAMTLARRELSAYFLSPMAYVLTTLFLAMVAMIFLLGVRVPGMGVDVEPVFRSGADSSLRPLFDVLAYGLIVVVPLLTMRLVSEEFRSGTIECLMTAPVTDGDVILGKFLGAMGLYLVLLATTFAFCLLVAVFGQPDWGVMLTGYLGMLLLGSAYVAVGVFTSTLTRHQLVAGLLGIAILTFFTLGMYLLVLVLPPTTALVRTASQMNMISYFGDFSKGIFDTTGVVFFVTVTAFFLFLSVRVLESRRWR
jgi:ABC-2 type transport system permease protein